MVVHFKTQKLEPVSNSSLANQIAKLWNTSPDCFAATPKAEWLHSSNNDSSFWHQNTLHFAKGGVRNANETQITLGIARLKAGNKDGAKEAFAGVQGDQTLKDLARLWTLRTR